MQPTKDELRTLPNSPGVYIYRDESGIVLYVGKAVNLKNRVRQYFTRDDAIGAKTQLLVSQIADIEIRQTASEFDALLLEAHLIKELLPKYNVIARDDKSPLYLLLTLSETLPHVKLVRKQALPKEIKKSSDAVFGPFQSGRVARSLMRSLRTIVPYCTAKRRNGKPCFYTHIGLCDPCPSVISALTGEDKKHRTLQYRKQLFLLRDILMGKSARVLSQLERDMKHFAKHQQYEQAAKVRNQLTHLYSLLTKRYDPSLYSQDDTQLDAVFRNEQDALRRVLSTYYPDIGQLTRIECVDISNTLGQQATGSLVVLTDGKVDTSSYKRFRIREGDTPNDYAMMQEVLRRRFSHPEWPMPDLLIVDGGKGQVTAATKALGERGVEVPLIGLAKRMEEIIVPTQSGWRVIRLAFDEPALHLLQRIRDEAHRFALAYHRKLRSEARL